MIKKCEILASNDQLVYFRRKFKKEVMFGKEVYIRRRESLIRKVGNGIILLLGNEETPMNYRDNTYHFRQDSTFLYFFGIDSPGKAGILDADSGKVVLFGNDIDLEDIIWMGPQESVMETALKVGITNTLPLGKLPDLISEAIQKGRRIHFLPPYRAENRIILQMLTGIINPRQKEYASVELIKAVVSLRSVKEPCEIDEIEKACAIGYDMHVCAMKMALPGVREQEIAGRMEGIAVSGGGSVSFPIILSQNGDTLHNHDHSQMLKNGRLVVVDAGAESLMHYASDFTRTIPVGGIFSPLQRDIYDIVLAANNRATELIRPGITYLSVHIAAAEVIASGLKDIGLMKGDVKEAVAAGAHALFFPHGLGHMMGLDVHDMEDIGQIYAGYDDEIRPVDQFGTAYLRLGRRLQPGFVITNEPGIYFISALIEKWKSEKINRDFIHFDKLEKYAGFGGIRIEDDILVTPEGARILGKRVPVTPEEILNVVSGK
jgi:Xaa-Pro aminopeptidase